MTRRGQPKAASIPETLTSEFPEPAVSVSYDRSPAVRRKYLSFSLLIERDDVVGLRLRSRYFPCRANRSAFQPLRDRRRRPAGRAKRSSIGSQRRTAERPSRERLPAQSGINDTRSTVQGATGVGTATRRLPLAELTSALGAGILGLGIGVLGADYLRGVGLPTVVGLLLHGWGMADKHRLEA